MKRILALLGSILSLLSAVIGIINGTYGFLKITRDHPVLGLDVMYVDFIGTRWGAKLLGDSSLLSYSGLLLPGILIIVGPILLILSILFNKKSSLLCALSGIMTICSMGWWIFALTTIPELSSFITSPWIVFDGSITITELWVLNVKYFWNLGLGFYLCGVGAILSIIATKSSK